MARLGIVHGPGAAVGVRDILRSARGVCQPVLIVPRPIAGDISDLLRATGALAEVVLVDGDDPGREMAKLGLEGVTTFHDQELEYTDAARDALGLAGVTITREPWDKLNQRRAFATRGVSRLRAVPVDSPGAFGLAVKEIGLPGVLKPRRAAASIGVSFIDDDNRVEAEVRERQAWSGLVYEDAIPPGCHPGGGSWIADYVSVETVSDDRQHHHVTVLDKLPISVVRGGADAHAFDVRETGDITPSRLPSQTMDMVLATTSRALDALGVRSRVTHTELRVSRGHVEVIEVNGRLGGEVARLLGLLSGPDLVAAEMIAALGRRVDTPSLATDQCAAVVYLPFPVRSGRVQSHVDRRRIRSIPAVMGVDEVAQCGATRSATEFRTSRLSLLADSQNELDTSLFRLMDELAGLFAPDGLDTDPWLTSLRQSCNA